MIDRTSTTITIDLSQAGGHIELHADANEALHCHGLYEGPRSHRPTFQDITFKTAFVKVLSIECVFFRKMLCQLNN